MRKSILLLLSFVFIGLSAVNTWPAADSGLLDGAKKGIQDAAANTDDWRQKRMLQNAEAALGAAQEADKKGDNKDAIKNKRKALKWVVQAVRDCMPPGEIPGQIGEALKNEGGMGEGGLSRFNDLIKALVNAKKSKEKSGFPWFHGMAINQLVLALDDLIDGGPDGFHPDKALTWYINAAASCEDVQELIQEILDYMNKHADDSGITDLSDADYAEAKRMLDELYKKKEAGAPSDEIIDLAEKLKAFLKEAGSRTGAARIKKYTEEAAEEEAAEQKAESLQVTTVRFTALAGETSVNKEFLGEVETIRFVAVDEKEIDPKDVSPEISAHDDSFNISIGRAAKIGTVILTGTGGIVRLIQGGTAGPPPGFTGVGPADGILDVRNGTINEILNIKSGVIDLTHAPQDHIVNVSGSPVSVIATRGDQLAISGSGIGPPITGTAGIDLISPGGISVASQTAAWGYNISMPEITKTKTLVPISAEVFGLDPADRVTFTFIPSPGQEITPQSVTIPASSAVVPEPVAEIMVEIPGPQGLNVIVSKEKGK